MNLQVLAPMALAEAPSREQLTPSQQSTFDDALAVIGGSPILLIEGSPGMGKSTVLQALYRRTGGKWLNAEDVMRAHALVPPSDYEQVVYGTIRDAIEGHEVVYFDNVGDYQQASHAQNYHRPDLFDAVFKAIYDCVATEGRKFIATANRGLSAPLPGEMIRYRPITITLEDFTQPDYRHFFAEHFGEAGVAAIDFDRVYSFSRKLSGNALGILCDLLKARGLKQPSTADVINLMNEQLLRSNVDTREVEAVRLDELVGAEAIVEKLDRTVLLPLREPALARELGLKPKHGVLLYGPPGTGKTTIGRALAHAMQGKFFMIDGDFDHQSCSFFGKVQALFAAAQRNAPSVIFIDDADVILTDPRLAYFGRYLLTMLDGLMNEASDRICVMMTAMDLRGLPLALLRSGRMEVWLEMKLPDSDARTKIIASYLEKLPIDTSMVDTNAVSKLTDGFTPADLRRLVADASGHLALDHHLKRVEAPFEVYLDQAAKSLREQKALADDAFKKRGGRQYH